MRRLIIPVVLLVGVLTLAASGLADPGGKGKGQAQGKNKFTFSLTTTDAGNSPGNCPANKSKHGHLVGAGVKGRFGGYLEGTITGGTFNKKGTCVAACFTSDFI